MAKIDTKLDAAQVIKQAYDEPNRRIRVDAEVSASISDVTIADPDGDQMDVNPDGSINVNVINPIDLSIDAATGDNIAIQDFDGDTLQVNPDGSINTNTTLPYDTDAGVTGVETLRTTSNLSDGAANPLTSSLVNANRVLHTQTPDSNTAATPFSALNDAVTLSVEGLNSVGFQLNSGTFTGTIVAEASVDGGTKWAIVPFYDPANSSVLTSLIFVNPNPDKIVSVVPIGGSSHIRVRVSAYTSGSATSLLRATQVASTTGAITASAFGTVLNLFPSILANVITLVLPANVNRKYAYISNNSGSTLRLQFSSSVGLSANTGLAIPSQDKFEIKGDNLFTGDIYALSSSDIDISITEGSP